MSARAEHDWHHEKNPVAKEWNGIVLKPLHLTVSSEAFPHNFFCYIIADFKIVLSRSWEGYMKKLICTEIQIMQINFTSFLYLTCTKWMIFMFFFFFFFHKMWHFLQLFAWKLEVVSLKSCYRWLNWSLFFLAKWGTFCQQSAKLLRFSPIFFSFCPKKRRKKIKIVLSRSSIIIIDDLMILETLGINIIQLGFKKLGYYSPGLLLNGCAPTSLLQTNDREL